MMICGVVLDVKFMITNVQKIATPNKEKVNATKKDRLD